nr:T9SS type B sorting domain-containing protein [uncultured Carboxylicivirga sp.]
MKYLTLTISIILLSVFVELKAQVGKEFWFVAPEVTNNHGDSPVVFRITTFDEGANVTISSPANGSFSTTNVYIAPNTLYTVSGYSPNDLENRPEFQINNKGILITSDKDISVYYEVVHANNPDKFTLKGNNALGTEFWVPSQNIYMNNHYSTPATEKIDIVATEDGTVVKVIPSIAVGSWSKGQEVEITLNRGETYSIVNSDETKESSMAGTYVSSNKQVAITISDDSVNPTWSGNGAWDLIGDQLIPTNVIGYEYVAVNTQPDENELKKDWSGNVIYPINKVFVLATQDNTQIRINGNSSLEAVLNKGEQKCIDITGDNMFIQASNPVYVYQLSSLNFANGDELGSALLPHVECTGSTSVSFTRIFTYKLYMQVLVKGNARNSFSVEGKNSSGNAIGNFLASADWVIVPGTGTGDEAWYTTNVNLSTDMGTGSPVTISNSVGMFHLSVLEQNNTSASYGYFSSYSNLKISGLTDVCYGNTLRLTTDVPMDTYKWYSLSTGNTILSTERDLYVTEGGKYWVRATLELGECELQDSIDVVFNRPEIELGSDTIVCAPSTIDFSGYDTSYTYLWSDGTTGSQTSVNVTANYNQDLSVLVTDAEGCSNKDTVNIQAFSVPEINLDKTQVCLGQAVTVTNTFARYEWSLNGGVLNTDPLQNYLKPTVSGQYTITCWTEDGCEATKTFQIDIINPITIDLQDEVTCIGESKRIYGPAGNGYMYQWNDGSTQSYIDLKDEGKYWLIVTDAEGCSAKDSAYLNYNLPIPMDLGADREDCDDALLTVANHADFSDYKWTFIKGGTETGITGTPTEYQYLVAKTDGSNEGLYKVEGLDINGCATKDSVNVSFLFFDPPQLTVQDSLCAGATTIITASVGYSNYRWYYNGSIQSQFNGQRSIEISQPGTYTVEVNYDKCVTSNSVTIHQYGTPSVALPSDMAFCPGDEAVLTVASYTPSVDGGDFDYMYWGTDSGNKQNDWTTASLNVNTAGTYTVTVVDEYGCIATDQMDVAEFTPTQIPLVDDEACSADGFLLQNPVSPVNSYKWYRIVGGTEFEIASNKDFLATQTGTYKLEIVDVNGCQNTNDVNITINQNPSFDLNDGVVCPGDDHTFAPQNVVGNLTNYQWSDGSASASLTTSITGQHTLVVTDDKGCTEEKSVTLNNFTPVPISLGGDRQECAGIDLTIPGSSNHSNYIWEFEGSTLNTPTPDYAYKIVNGGVTDNGTYKAIAEDINGCIVEDEVHVEFIQAADLLLTKTENLCEGEAIDIIASNLYKSYYWYHGTNHLSEYDGEQMITINEEGRYTVVASIDGCTKTTHTDVDKHGLPSVTLPSDYAICPGAETTISGVSYSQSADGNGFDYLYWNNDENIRSADWATATYQATAPGIYSVTVVDQVGCKATDDIEITEHTVETPDLKGPFTACNNIGITLQNPIVDALSYSWYWSDGTDEVNVGNDEDYLATIQGKYKIYVEDKNGCDSQGSTDVNINMAPEITVADNTVCPGNSGLFTGPTDQPYQYLWSEGSNAPTFTTSVPGQYALTVTDNNGCVGKTEFTLTNYSPVAFDLGDDKELCAGDELVLQASNAHTNYSWYFNNQAESTPSVESIFTVSNVQLGNIGTYKAIANDVNGCPVEDEVDVLVHDIPVPELSASKYLCSGESVDLNASLGFDQFSWSKDGVSMGQFDNMATISVTEGGAYTVEVELYGCTKSNAIDIQKYALPSVKLPDDFAICPGSPSSFGVDSYTKGCEENVFDYLYWNNESNQRYGSWQTARCQVPGIGDYSVTVVDTLGCVATDELSITEHEVTPLTLPETFTNCDNAGQLLSVEEVNYRTYTWSKLTNQDDTQLATDEDYLAEEAGSYRLTLTDEHGCVKDATTVVILNPSPDVDLGDDRMMCDQDYLLITPGDNYVSYKWNDDASLNTNQLKVTSAGKYKVEVANVYGCVDADSTNITVLELPHLDLGPDVSECPGVMHTVVAPAGFESYLWSNGSVDQTVLLAGGSHNLKVTDANGCSSIDTINVNYYASPVVDLGEDEYICPVEGSIELDAGDFSTYQWQNGLQTRSIMAEMADTVNVVSVIDQNGCRGFDTKVVRYLESEDLELLNDTSICSSDSLMLEVDWDLNNIVWSTGEHYPEIWIKDAGEYWVNADDGCFIMADTMQMVVVPTPMVASLDTSIYAQVVLYVEGGTEPYEYSINDESYQEKNVFSNLADGEHILNVVDVNGCMATDTVNINNYLDINIPKFFTPNGDGYNDTWEIEGLDRLPDSEIRIYDRYGKLLIKYLASDPGWDGKYLGKPVRSDDYWYVIELIPVNKLLKGNVSIVR